MDLLAYNSKANRMLPAPVVSIAYQSKAVVIENGANL
jgi:hypothetical protein